MMERRIGDRRTVGLGSVHVRSWTVVAFVAVVALGGGVLVAGLPSSSEAFVLPDSATATPADGALVAAVVPGELDVVLVTATDEPDAASRTVSSLNDAGYASVTTAEAAEAAEASDETVIYFADGLDEEAAALAAALDTPDARLESKTDTPVTADGSDAEADLVVVLAPID